MKINVALNSLCLAVVALQFAPDAGLRHAAAHEITCDKRAGIELARCERHQRMFARCGPIKGDAHFACDREFLLANPLDCGALKGDDVRACQAELGAAKTCQAQEGRAFMRCVRDATTADSNGAPNKN